MKQNIVLISVDSLRADFCPWLGYDDLSTPTLSAASNEGVSYTNAIAPGQSTPASMPAIFTGYDPLRVENENSVEDAVGAHQTIPQILKSEGYDTIGFTPNPFTSCNFGFDSGFQQFEDFFDKDSTGLERVRSWIRKNTDKKSAQGLRLILNMLGQGDITVSWGDYYSDILDAVDEASEPFFLWVFLLEPHWPYLPSRSHRDEISLFDLFTNIKMSRAVDRDPTEADQERLQRVYKNTVLDVDDFIQQIFTDLEDYNPAYIFHSDHGESLGEHGNWGHKGYIFPENARVPLEIWNIDHQEDIDSPISLRKVPEIIVSLANGGPDSWDQFCSPTVSCRLSESEHSIYGEGWFHNPDADMPAPKKIDDLCEEIYARNNHRYEERRYICAESKDLASTVRL